MSLRFHDQLPEMLMNNTCGPTWSESVIDRQINPNLDLDRTVLRLAWKLFGLAEDVEHLLKTCLSIAGSSVQPYATSHTFHIFRELKDHEAAVCLNLLADPFKAILRGDAVRCKECRSIRKDRAVVTGKGNGSLAIQAKLYARKSCMRVCRFQEGLSSCSGPDDRVFGIRLVCYMLPVEAVAGGSRTLRHIMRVL